MQIDLKTPLSQLVGGARGRVLETIAQVGRPFSIRQLAEMSDVHHVQASKLLREFEGMGLVDSQRIGKSIAYKPVEGNVLLAILRRVLLLREEIIGELERSARDAPTGVTIAIFGSVASGRASAGSDLDILVITEDGAGSDADDWIREFLEWAERASGMSVNPLRYTQSQWRQDVSDGVLVTRTIEDNHRVLVGSL